MNELARRRRALMAGKKKARLPAEYQEVEYVETQGDVSIQTELHLPTTALRILAKYSMKYSVAREQYLFADRDSSRVTLGVFSASNANARVTGLWVGFRTVVDMPAVPDESIYDFVATVGGPNISTTVTLTGTINGERVFPVSVTGTTRAYGSKGLRLFDANGSTKMVGKLFHLSIFSVGTLYYNFIPCYRIGDGMTGIYETETGNFYGSNDLVKGVDVK